MNRVLIAFVLAVASVMGTPRGFAQGLEPGRRWALVVTGDRDGARNASASSFAQALRRNYGYGADSIQELPGATLGGFYSSLNGLTERVRRTDSLVVYVAARTLSLSRGQTTGEQIVLVDGNEKEPWTLLGLSDLLERVRAVGAGATLLMLDDCVQTGSGYSSQRPSQMIQQSKPALSAGSPIQVLNGCPPSAFGSAAAAALAAAADSGGSRRITPVELAKRMMTSRSDLRAAATGEGAFAFERVEAPGLALSRLEPSNNVPQDRQRAINEMVRTALSDKTSANVAQAHAAFMKIAMNRSDDSPVRVAAVRGIGLIGAPTGVRDLGAVIRDDTDAGVVNAGISALERIRSAAAINELEQLIDSPRGPTRAGAIRALGRMESRGSLPRILRRLGADQEAEPIVAGLEVLPVLADNTNAQAVSTVLELLRKGGLPPSVEPAAVATLGLLRTPRAEQVLIARLNPARSEPVRAAAAIALSSLDLAQGAARERALIAALNDQAASVRESAAFALGRIKATGATTALVSLLRAEQRSPGARAAAASGLGEIGAANAKDALVAALEDQSPVVRRAAAAALGKIGDRSVLERLRSLRESDKDPYVRSAAAAAIGTLSNASELIDADLASSDPVRRREAISRVARTGRPDAVTLIVGRLADPDPEVVAAAITELSGLTTSNPTPALMAELERRDRTREAAARRRGAAVVLGARPADPAALDALLAHAADEDVTVRGAVLSALANFDDPRVLGALREAASVQNPALQQAAADAFTAYGNTLYAKQRSENAIAAFESALRLHTELFGANDPQVAVDLNNRGVALQRLKRFGEAEENLRGALRIREDVLGPIDAETATSLVNLGLVYASQNSFERAEPLYLRALKIRETVFGPDDPTMLPLLDELSRMYRTQGRIAEAGRISQRAAAIRNPVVPKGH